MKEILFKAKRLDNGDWVEGYLVRHPSASQIGDDYSTWYIHVPPTDPDDSGGVFNVDPSTVSQYTGLTDKNGKKIFEGDIVKWGHIPGYRENPVRTAEVKIAPDIQFDAIICNTRTVFHYGAFAYAGRIDKALEVIGSIHDGETEGKK